MERPAPCLGHLLDEVEHAVRVAPLLSYHETSLTKLSSSAMPAFASKMDEWGSVMKSVETTSSSV